MTINIIHGTYRWNYPVYRNTDKIISNIPPKFRLLLAKKMKKFFHQLVDKNMKPLEFTFGYDNETNVSAIAIVHPKDNFSRKIGYKIVKGRILRQNGNYKYRNQYHPIPDYIEVEE